MNLASQTPAQPLTLEFQAVRFEKFGFPGVDLDAPGGPQAQLDYFFWTDGREAGHGGFRNLPEPAVLLDLGDLGRRAFRANEFTPAKLHWSTITQGPISVNRDGGLIYRGGFGETRFRLTLGRDLSVEHTLTANLVEVDLGALRRREAVAASGLPYRVAVRVTGPADLRGYQVAWGGENITWEQPTTGFTRTGEIWQAVNRLTVRSPGPFDPAKFWEEIRSASRGESPELSGKYDVSVRATMTRPGGQRVFDYESGISDDISIYAGPPAIRKFEIFSSDGRGPFGKASGPVDLFLTGAEQRLHLKAYVTLADGQSQPLLLVRAGQRYEVVSSDPAVASLHDSKGGPGEVEARGEAPGSTTLSGTLSGEHVTEAGKELQSDPITLNVNRLFLFATEEAGGRRTYKLMVAGPTDMTSYRAVWRGARGGQAFERDAAGNFAATLSTAERITAVEVRKVGRVVAVAELAIGKDVPQAFVKLLPAEPPVTTINKVPLADAGSLERLTDCRKRITFKMEYLGFDPGTTVQEYCGTERAKQQQELKALREQQKEMNRLVGELERQGQELVVFADTMRVGAAVKGSPWALGGTLFCGWLILKGGNLKLGAAVTPVEWVSETEGACFNTVRNLKQGFNPDADLRVDLFVALPQPVRVVEGARVISRASRRIQVRDR